MQASITLRKFERWNCVQPRHLPCGRTVTLSVSLFGAHNKPNWECCPGPEGRNTAHFSAFDDRSKEISCSFPRSWPCRLYWESFFSTVDSFGGGLLCFFEIWKNWSAHPSTPASLMFFPDFEIFKKLQVRGRIRKEVCWQILIPRVINVPQNRL